MHGGTAIQNALNSLLVFFYLSFFYVFLPSSLYIFVEISRAIPWQQNDSHLTGLAGRELSHHHVHLLLSLQLQWYRDQIHFDVWPTVTCFHGLLHCAPLSRSAAAAAVGMFFCWNVFNSDMLFTYYCLKLCFWRPAPRFGGRVCL